MGSSLSPKARPVASSTTKPPKVSVGKGNHLESIEQSMATYGPLANDALKAPGLPSASSASAL